MLRAIIIDTETGKEVNSVPDSDVILALGIDGKKKELSRVFSGGGIPFMDYINAVAAGVVQSVLHEVPRRENVLFSIFLLLPVVSAARKRSATGRAERQDALDAVQDTAQAHRKNQYTVYKEEEAYESVSDRRSDYERLRCCGG